MTMPLILLSVLAFYCIECWASPPDQVQTDPPPAWPSAVAVSPDGAWLAVGLVSEPARVETWRNGERRGILDLPKPEQAHAVSIGNDGLVTVGLSRVAARTPYISLIQASADGRVLRRCQSDLADPYVRRPAQWRGVQDLAVNGLLVIAASVEGGVHRVDLGSCSIATLRPAPAGDAERQARLSAGGGIVSVEIENRPPDFWHWNGNTARSVSITTCEALVLNLPSEVTVRQRVNSSDCWISVVRTQDSVYQCKAGSCTQLSLPKSVWNVP